MIFDFGVFQKLGYKFQRENIRKVSIFRKNYYKNIISKKKSQLSSIREINF